MSKRINKIFSDISKNYDFMNHFFSLNIDKDWRNQAVIKAMTLLEKTEAPKILDVATGTGDLTIQLSKKLLNKNFKIIAIDFNKEMLTLGKEKAKKLNIKNVSFELKDALKTNFSDNFFDLSISGFALRNLDNLDVFAKEQKRILKKNAYFLYLDMAMPDKIYQRLFFKIYSGLIKFIGFFIDYEAYSWLSDSIKNFDKKNLIRILKQNNFRDVNYIELKTGIAYIVYGKK
ncbi:MAG: ubiquinone/menaquinone biosynthesis methyltransferase [Candidatus Micrarchaeaceae archaeon]